MLKIRLCIEKTHVLTIKLKEPKKPEKLKKFGITEYHLSSGLAS